MGTARRFQRNTTLLTSHRFWPLVVVYSDCRMTDSHAADVQAELQQYLNSKNINSLFISIVESLLIEKPANPIAFIIEYLYKQYPDQAKVAIDGLASPGAGAGPAVAE